MLVGKKEYGTWKDGSSVYKDSKGYYIVAVNLNAPLNGETMYKKYLKTWRPDKGDSQLCFIKKRWTTCKTKKHKKRKTQKIRNT